MSSSRLDRAVQAWKRLWKSNAIQDDHPQSDQQILQSDNGKNNKTRNNKKSRNTRNNKKSRNPIKSKKSRNPINNKKASGTKSQKKYNQKRNKNSKSNNTDFLRYQQQDLHNHNLTKEDVEVFGDMLILPKPKHTFQIVSQNIHNLPESPLTSKSRQCIDFIRSSQADVFAMQEVGLCHCKLKPENHWHERIYGRLESSICLGSTLTIKSCNLSS